MTGSEYAMLLRRLAPSLRLGLALTVAGLVAVPASLVTATPTTAAVTTASTITVAPVTTRAYVDHKFLISGIVTHAPGQSRTVWLQGRQTSGTWARYTTTTTTSGAYRLTVPTAGKGTRTWRVTAPAEDGLTTATSRPVTVTVTAKPVPKSSTFSLLIPDDNGTWARWNPCQVIDYRVNPGASGKAGAARIADTKGAAYRLSKATGISFVYRGTTTAVPGKQGSTYPTGTELVIAWAKPGTSAWIPTPKRGTRAPAGMGGAMNLIRAYNTSALPVWKIAQGGVVLDSTLPLAGGFGSGPTYGYHGTRGQLLMHEMAHASGLGHTGAKSQIMYGTLTRKPAVYGKGDLAGLRLLGKAQGCMSATAPR